MRMLLFALALLAVPALAQQGRLLADTAGTLDPKPASRTGGDGAPHDHAAAPPAVRDNKIRSSIASNFNTKAELFAAAPHVTNENQDGWGAFRFICNAAHISYDDPIVYPGQPGKSHLHQFFGNTKTDAHSTYESLRTTGDSSCTSKLNRSGYWIPAMMDGHGKVVRPNYNQVYYKRPPEWSDICANRCVALPRGLRFIFGYDMINGKPNLGSHFWQCLNPRDNSMRSEGNDLASVAKGCPVGGQIVAIVNAPFCWNGTDLDSPDHRSHMAALYHNRCPDSHPYLVPAFTLQTFYTVDENVEDWYLSSDRMPGMANHVPGSTLHSDWWGAWDDETMKTWTDNCINRLLSCSGGDLGNGTAMKTFEGFSWEAKPHAVPVPALP